MQNIPNILVEITDEYERAIKKFPKFTSAHERYAILKEEVDELWDEIKKKDSIRNTNKLREEAIQIAAMAVRFVNDLCQRKDIK